MEMLVGFVLCVVAAAAALVSDHPSEGLQLRRPKVQSDYSHADFVVNAATTNGSGNVFIAQNLWLTSAAARTVHCMPPCTYILPPLSLSKPTTISFPPSTTVLEVGYLTPTSYVQNNGQSITTSYYTAITVTTVLTVPKLTTSLISFSNLLIPPDVNSSLVYPDTSIVAPPFVITNNYKNFPSAPSNLPVVTRTIYPSPYPWSGLIPNSTTSTSSSSTSSTSGVPIVFVTHTTGTPAPKCTQTAACAAGLCTSFCNAPCPNGCNGGLPCTTTADSGAACTQGGDCYGAHCVSGGDCVGNSCTRGGGCTGPLCTAGGGCSGPLCSIGGGCSGGKCIRGGGCSGPLCHSGGSCFGLGCLGSGGGGGGGIHGSCIGPLCNTPSQGDGSGGQDDFPSPNNPNPPTDPSDPDKCTTSAFSSCGTSCIDSGSTSCSTTCTTSSACEGSDTSWMSTATAAPIVTLSPYSYESWTIAAIDSADLYSIESAVLSLLSAIGDFPTTTTPTTSTVTHISVDPTATEYVDIDFAWWETPNVTYVEYFLYDKYANDTDPDDPCNPDDIVDAPLSSDPNNPPYPDGTYDIFGNANCTYTGTTAGPGKMDCPFFHNPVQCIAASGKGHCNDGGGDDVTLTYKVRCEWGANQ